MQVQLAADRGVSEHGVQLGGEHDPAPGRCIVQRLLPHAIAGQQELLALRVPEREGKHAIEMIDAMLAVFLPGMHDGFRVRTGDEAMAPCHQVPPQNAEVVDLPVLDHVD